MKVKIFNYDHIKQSNDGIEVGKKPVGVGMERLRWTGSELVDLADRSFIWCEYKNGGFILHAIKVPCAQLIEMSYSDRKKLWSDNGVYKIKSDKQIITETNLEYRRSHYTKISDQMDIILKYFETKTDLTEELQNLINDWRGVKTTYPKEIS